MAAEPAILARQAAGGDLSGDVAKWLIAGLSLHLGGEPLERALRLDRANRTRQRNRALLEAAEFLDDGSSRWMLAARLENAVRRFEARVWPRVRHEPSPDLGEIDAALFRAFVADAGMLRCQRALYDLLPE